MTKAPDLMLFCTRRLLLWWVDEEQILRHHLVRMSAWDAFQSVVADTLAAVRGFINKNLQAPSVMSVLETADGLLTDAHVDQLNGMCANDAHVKVRATCYQRQRSPLTSVLHTCKRVGNDVRMNEDASDEVEVAASSSRVPVEVKVLLRDWVSRFDPR